MSEFWTGVGGMMLVSNMALPSARGGRAGRFRSGGAWRDGKGCTQLGLYSESESLGRAGRAGGVDACLGSGLERRRWLVVE